MSERLTLKKLESRIEELEAELKRYKTSTLKTIINVMKEAEDHVREEVRKEIEYYVNQYKPSPKAVARRKRIIMNRIGGLF